MSTSNGDKVAVHVPQQRGDWAIRNNRKRTHWENGRKRTRTLRKHLQDSATVANWAVDEVLVQRSRGLCKSVVVAGALSAAALSAGPSYERRDRNEGDSGPKDCLGERTVCRRNDKSDASVVGRGEVPGERFVALLAKFFANCFLKLCLVSALFVPSLNAWPMN